MSVEQNLAKKIVETFAPSFYQVLNESQNHAGPATDSHFKLTIVSEQFNDLALIKRHRLVNALFAQELTQIHALAMHTYTQDEWQKRQHNTPESPKCSH